MGVSVSTNVQTLKNDMITKSIQACGPTNATNIIDWQRVKIIVPPDCPGGSNINLTQASMVDAKCYLDALQSTAATTAQTLSADAQAGIGFAVGTNIANTAINIENVTDQKCAGQSSTNVLNFNDVTLEACDVTLVQNASSKAACQIKATTDIVNNVAIATNASSTGASLFGLLFGNSKITIIIVAIAIILVVGGIAAAYLKSRSGKKSGKASVSTPVGKVSTEIDTDSLIGGGDNNKPYIILIIVALLIVIVFLVNKSSNNQKEITETDIDKLNRTITEAQQIAGLSAQKPRHYPVYQQATQNYYAHSDNSNLSEQSNPEISQDRISGSEPSYYELAYDYDSEENSLENYYKPLL